MNAPLEFPILIADIGGTHARFAIVESASSPQPCTDVIKIADFLDFISATSSWLQSQPLKPKSFLLAIAGPVKTDPIKLTNEDWQFDPQKIIATFNLKQCVFMNDFAAQAMAVPALNPDDTRSIGRARPSVEDAPKVILGPGTGLGIAYVLPAKNGWAILPGEGGNIDLGPREVREFEIWPYLESVDGRVSQEMLLSGRGLENIFHAITRQAGHKPDSINAEDITQLAISGANPIATESIDLFITLFARLCGDATLMTMAQGGVFITGGIFEKIALFLDEKHFRSNFENKAPYRKIMESIPVSLITIQNPSMRGLWTYATRPEAYDASMALLGFQS